MFTFCFDCLFDSFSVRDSGFFEDCFRAEFILELLAEKIELSFAHAVDEHFARFHVLGNGEAYILVLKAVEAAENLILVALLGCVNRHREYGLGHNDGRERVILTDLAESISRLGCGKLCDSSHISGVCGVGVFGLFAENEGKSADLFVGVLVCVVNGNSAPENAAHNLEEGKSADESVGNGLEDSDDKRAVVLAFDFDFLAVRR